MWIFTFMTLHSLYKSYKSSPSLKRNTKKGLSLEKQMALFLIFMVVVFTFTLFPTKLFTHSFLFIQRNHKRYIK